MRHILFLVLILCSSFNAFAQKIGVDALGMAMYCDTYLRAPKMVAVSTLMNTFGDPLPCIDKRAAMGGLELVQVDLIDATCWRNHSCVAGVPKPDDLKAILERSRKVSVLAEKYQQIEFWLSPALEHDVRDNNTVLKMLQTAQAGCPRCKVLNSPMTGARPRGYPIEQHGTTVKDFSVSGDGASSFDGDNISSDCPPAQAAAKKCTPFEHRTSGKYSTFLWWNELNLRCTGEKTAPPPPAKRTSRPTADQFRQAYFISLPEASLPPAPRACGSVVGYGRGEILKTNAEQYCNGNPGANDKRSNKPLLIIAKSGRVGDKLKVLRSDGKEVACFAYYGPYQSGLSRWYMGSCSGHAPAALYDALGGEWGFVPLGGGKCLKVNAVRRLGSYR